MFNIISDIDYSWVTEIWSGHLHSGQGTYDGICSLEDKFARYL